MLLIDSLQIQSYLPHPLELGKSTSSMMKLASKITGCIIWSSHYPQDRKVVVYVNHDQGQKLEVKTKNFLKIFLPGGGGGHNVSL